MAGAAEREAVRAGPGPGSAAPAVPAAEGFCRRLPKLELHAHLNGSVRPGTLRELGGDPATLAVGAGGRSLAECFKVFALIHAVTTSPEVLARITREVIADFEADGVCYLELRTSPKHRPEAGLTKASYLDTVLKVLEAHNASRTSALTEVNLLVSIDRRETAEEARATVELACAAKEAGRPVVGIDLSGNPALGKNAMLTYGDALSLARAAGLRTTLHFAEVDNPEEVGAMLEFQPDRLGHAVCLGAAQKEALFEAGIPVEICLTSNKITESVASYADHHLGEFLERRHPVSICTDDSGVFETTSAQEHAIAAATFGLSEAELLRLSRAAVNQTFAGAATKARLRAVFDAFAIESVNELNK